MHVSQLFVECLEKHWVKRIFWVPGEENLALLDAIKESTIRFITTRNEQTAVFMAGTYGRLTGKAWVALATLWPGATNMMTWIAQAQLGWFPLLVITGQKPIKKSKQWHFQLLAVTAMMKPVTQFSQSIVDWARVATSIAQAMLTAESERPGAVHLELPEDIAQETIEWYEPVVFEKIRRPIPDEKAIQSLITKLENAKQPLILVWGWANRKRVSNYLTKFITQTNIPFFSSQMWKWVVDERLPQYIGTAATTNNDGIHDIIEQSDLILAVWHDTIEKPTHCIQRWKNTVIHINFFMAQPDELYKPSMQIIGDIGNVFWQLYENNLDTTHRNFSTLYKESKQFQKTLAQETTPLREKHLSPQALIKTVRQTVDDDAIIALDNGLYKLRFARNYRAYAPNTLLLDNALASMGSWYASGLMAKLCYPDTQVVAVVWDWWLMMNLWDLETVVRVWVNMTIIVLNDSAYGMIKHKQHNDWYGSYGLDFTNPDFVTLAESFWAKWYRVETPQALGETLKNSLNEPWLTLIDVPFYYPDSF